MGADRILGPVCDQQLCHPRRGMRRRGTYGADENAARICLLAAGGRLMGGMDPDDFDDGGTSDEDLWFLPGPEACEEDVPPGAAPLPRANRTLLFDPRDWRAAQDALSDDLARLTLIFGELDQRVRQAGPGARQRLALREVADLSWWSGDRLPMDKLALWVALRVGSADDTEQALARAGWAMRRLSAGPFPSEGLSGFLERLEPNDGGGAFDMTRTADLAAVLAGVAGLHPVTQAAVLFQAWRIIGVDQSRDIEAAVLAARHGAGMSRLPGQGALFLPLATTGPTAFRGQGSVEDKLRAWLGGAEQACLAALLHLDRLSAWRQGAATQIADLSGRTPGRLLAVLEAWPLVSAPLAEAEAGVSRAAVQRNFDLLTDRGVVREITGQGRYRVWTAHV